MATSIGGAAARGLESGFDLGLRSDAAAEAKRSRSVQEDFQRQTQTRADEAAARAVARDQQTFALKASHDELGRLQGMAADFHAAGKAIPDDFARQYQQVYGAHRTMIDAALQPYVNKASQLAVGQLDMGEMSPTDVYRTVTAATRLTPQQMEQVTQGVGEVHAGMETGNQSLLLQGANKVMAKSLNQGLGALAPNGRPIVRKELIALTPARGADGRDHPDMVIPLLRVHTDDGGYYDAPMTQNRSTDPNDMVKAIPIKALMDGLGNMGTLTAALENPQVKAKYQEGAAASQDWTAAALGVAGATARAKQGGPLMQRLALIDSRRASGEIDPETADTMTKAALGIKPTTAKEEAQIKVLEERAKAIPLDTATKARAVEVRGAGKGKAGSGAGGSKAGPTGLATSLNASNKDLHGEEFAATLDPMIAAKVRGIANGTLDPKGATARNSERINLEALVTQYKGDYSSKTYPTAAATEKAFATGIEGRKTRSFNVAIEHMNTARDMGIALNNGNFQKFNELANWFATQTGKPAPTNFEAVRDIVADEIVSGVIGSTGALADREKAANSIRASQSPQQMIGVLQSFQELMVGQLKGLKKQYEAGGGQKNFEDTFLLPESREILRGMLSKQSASRGPPNHAPAPAAAPAAPTGAPRTATNPATGERLMLKDGQWVPLK